MKRSLGIFIMIILVASLVLSSCSQPATTSSSPATSAAPTTSSAPTTSAAPAKVYELKFSDHDPPDARFAKPVYEFVKRVEEQSGGRLKITTFWAEALLKTAGGELYRGIQTGIADFAYYVPGSDAGIGMLSLISKLPFMFGQCTREEAAKVMTQLWAEFPEIAQEYEGLVMLSPRVMPATLLHMVKIPVKVPADLKGLKISGRAEWADLLQAVDAAALSLPIYDWYTSLERGLADGQVTNLVATDIYKTITLQPYHTVGAGGLAFALDVYPINAKTWNSLPPDLQKIFKDNIEWLSLARMKDADAQTEELITTYTAKGHQFITCNTDEMKLWLAAAKTAHEKYIASCEAKGLTKARTIYNRILELAAQYKK